MNKQSTHVELGIEKISVKSLMKSKVQRIIFPKGLLRELHVPERKGVKWLQENCVSDDFMAHKVCIRFVSIYGFVKINCTHSMMNNIVEVNMKIIRTV